MDTSNDFAVGYAVGDNAANRNCYGNGMFGADGGFFWIFALLLLPMMTNGGFWGNNGRGEPVTESGLCNAMNFNNLENAVGRGFDQQTQFAMQNQRDLCTGFASTNAAINQARFENQNCCCETQKEIIQNRYEAAQNTSAIMQNNDKGVQRILDYLCNQENRNLRDENMRNYIQSQFCGVPRFQPGTVYGSVPVNPFFGNWNNCGNCCGNGNI